jgi:D-alanyl-lipoteichoic acid acyltransferase DltB (MBOAT superfamily)
MRVGVLAVASVACALLLDREMFAGLVVTAAAAYLLMHGIARVRDAKVRWNVTLVAIGCVVAVFLGGRALGFGAARVSVAGLRVGLFALDMWLFLRLVSLLWEVGSGKIAPLPPAAFATWIALPFTFVGPLLRPSELTAWVDGAPTTPWRTFSGGWWRSVAGGGAMLSVAVVVAMLLPASEAQPSWLKVAGIVWNPVSFYLAQAGYCTLMTATAAAWGLVVPENFNRPFGRVNLSEFWMHWNMTATRLFRDYLFFARWGFKGRPNFYVNGFLVFFLVGAWHDTGPFYLLWGTYHGLGYAGYMWFKANKKRLSRFRPPVSDGVLRRASIALTFVFVILSWFIPLRLIKAFHLVAQHLHH